HPGMAADSAARRDFFLAYRLRHFLDDISLDGPNGLRIREWTLGARRVVALRRRIGRSTFASDDQGDLFRCRWDAFLSHQDRGRPLCACRREDRIETRCGETGSGVLRRLEQ